MCEVPRCRLTGGAHGTQKDPHPRTSHVCGTKAPEHSPPPPSSQLPLSSLQLSSEPLLLLPVHPPGFRRSIQKTNPKNSTDTSTTTASPRSGRRSATPAPGDPGHRAPGNPTRRQSRVRSNVLSDASHPGNRFSRRGRRSNHPRGSLTGDTAAPGRKRWDSQDRGAVSSSSPLATDRTFPPRIPVRAEINQDLPQPGRNSTAWTRHRFTAPAATASSASPRRGPR